MDDETPVDGSMTTAFHAVACGSRKRSRRDENGAHRQQFHKHKLVVAWGSGYICRLDPPSHDRCAQFKIEKKTSLRDLGY